jgi:hypothetical protein
MDGRRFDDLAKGLATTPSRRKVLKGLAGGIVAGMAALLGRSEADAQRITQAYCGNQVCDGDPSVCRDGCSCCVFGNGNTRCMPLDDCLRRGGAPGGGTSPNQGTCAAGANRCLDDSQACNNNGDCGCVPTVTGGTFCAYDGAFACAPCERDSDCELMGGPGAACVDASTCGGLGCNETGGRVCWAPCPPIGS